MTRPTVLVLPNTIFFPPYLEEIEARGREGLMPRTWLADVDADVTILDQRLQTDPPRWRRPLYRRLPMWLVQVLEAFRVGRRFDAVFVWSLANVALVLALLLRLTRRRITLVCLLTRISEPKKARLLRRVHTHITRIILPPQSQREFAMRELGVPAEKLIDLPWTLDVDFWRPTDPKPVRDTICAAGGEMRDYVTLVRALDGLDIPCHIAGVLDTSRPDWWNAVDDDRAGEELVPDNVTFGTMPSDELRDLYARSRFVVVPLHATDSDNGITCMNEAWAMSRPVIVSDVAGQQGAFTEGVEGVWVPQGDVDALRRAIIDLWANPASADTMGAAGRHLVEREKSNAVFSAGLSRVLAEAAGMIDESARTTG